jgi:hypothetical protein
MKKKGGRTSLDANLEAAKEVLFDLIDFLETEFDKLGDATTMTRSQHQQLSGYVERATSRLGELMGPIRDRGLDADESYTSMFEHARDLILRLESDFEITGASRRRKTRRTKKTRK